MNASSMNVDLTSEECEVLRLVLENYLERLRTEVGRTENYEMRQMLKRREAIINKLMDVFNPAQNQPETKQT